MSLYPGRREHGIMLKTYPYRLFLTVVNLCGVIFQMCLIISHACTSNYRKLSVMFYAYKRCLNFNSTYSLCNIFFSPNTSLSTLQSVFQYSLETFFASKHFYLGNTRSAFPYQQQCMNAENSLENCAVC